MKEEEEKEDEQNQIFMFGFLDYAKGEQSFYSRFSNRRAEIM